METSPLPLMRSRRAVRPPSGSRAFGGHLAPEAGASHIASAHPKCSLNKSSRSLQLCDFLGNSANAVRWQVWTALLLYVLMRFLCVMSRWSHSFTRLFTLLRATLWRKIDLWDLLSRIMSEIVQHNQMRGISEDVLRENQKDIISAASRNARDRLKANFILTRIAEKEGIDVKPQELRERVQILANQYRVKFEKMMSDLEEKRALGQVREEVLIGKVLDFLTSNANVEIAPEDVVNS
jgi:Bacterial trigger factor protein (TF) C-terminus